MSEDVDELRSEVADLREDVAQLRVEARQAAGLSRMVDQDVADFRAGQRAHLRSLNALQVTQSEHGQTLTHLAETVGGLAVQVAGLAEVQGQHTTTLDQHTTTLTEHGDLLREILRRLPEPTAGG